MSSLPFNSSSWRTSSRKRSSNSSNSGWSNQRTVAPCVLVAGERPAFENAIVAVVSIIAIMIASLQSSFLVVCVRIGIMVIIIMIVIIIIVEEVETVIAIIIIIIVVVVVVVLKMYSLWSRLERQFIGVAVIVYRVSNRSRVAVTIDRAEWIVPFLLGVVLVVPFGDGGSIVLRVYVGVHQVRFVVVVDIWTHLMMLDLFF